MKINERKPPKTEYASAAICYCENLDLDRKKEKNNKNKQAIDYVKDNPEKK